MPNLSWQRRRSHSEHAAAVEREFYQAAAERRRARKIPVLETPQTRSFRTDVELEAFAATLRQPDVAITITPDRPKPPSPAQGRLDEAFDTAWPIQWPVPE